METVPDLVPALCVALNLWHLCLQVNMLSIAFEQGVPHVIRFLQ